MVSQEPLGLRKAFLFSSNLNPFNLFFIISYDSFPPLCKVPDAHPAIPNSRRDPASLA